MPGVFVLDKTAILERLGGDEEIFTMMSEMYVADLENNCASLSDALASGDASVLRREAHTVKGLLATFSDDVGAADAARVEHSASKGNVADQADAVAGLLQRMRQLAAALAAG